MSLQSIDIFGFNSGVQKRNKKPFLFVDDAFQNLENAYCWREEIKKREGIKLIGRLQRNLTNEVLLGGVGWAFAGTWGIDIPQLIGINVTEPNANLKPGTVVVTIQAPISNVLTDNGDGTMTISGVGTTINSATINYATGIVSVITNAAGAASPATVTMSYYPTLPVMGIPQRELAGINDEETLWFDTKYCYENLAGEFQEFIPVTTWNGNDSDFFWATNYRGVDASIRLFFVTNFALSGSTPSAGSPMRYTDGSTWTDFEPFVSSTQQLFSARILIPYYGRLLALNCWEGTARNTSINIYNRCRFSQIGDPVDQTDGWRSDVFGRGGFIDAPINEEIVSATFFKNTLIVQFERSTWRLQYLGEYGLPFIWERISSDYGSESTFSTILFDRGVLAVGDKAIVTCNGGTVERIDLQIPDKIYDFKNVDNGTKRVQGIRDFEKEIVYWSFADYTEFEKPFQYYPNKTLVFNYRNNTFAFFRNNVTAYGYFQYQDEVSWDSEDIFWDDYNVLWNSSTQVKKPMIVSGNQQGFCHFYGYPDAEANPDSTIDAMDQESLAVMAVTAATTIQLRVPNHNLSDDEFIYLTGMIYVVTASATPGSTTLNDTIYGVKVEDINTITLTKWSVDDQKFYSEFEYTNVGTYMGGGVIALFPNMNIETKDFNPLKPSLGLNIKTSYIDFLFDASSPSPINVSLKMNTTLMAKGNLLVGNKNVETSNSKTGYVTNITQDALTFVVTVESKNHCLLTGDQITMENVLGSTELNEILYTVTFLTTDTFSIQASGAISPYAGGGYWWQAKQQYFTLSAEYAWHRFYANAFGQFFSLILKYSNDQMNEISTHRQNFVLNAMQIWFRPGGKNIFGK